MKLFQNAARLFSAQSAKARTPMIKFRKGSAASSTAGAGSKAGQGTAVSGGGAKRASADSAPTPKAKPKKSGAQQSVIVTELPHKFHRQPISQEEIDYINRGGPD